jgi:hypothetical protein
LSSGKEGEEKGIDRHTPQTDKAGVKKKKKDPTN